MALLLNDESEDVRDRIRNMGEDAWEKFAHRFAVFCTVQVPTDKLNDFFDHINNWSPPSSGVVACLITSRSDLGAPPEVLAGTHSPVANFRTPFKGYSIRELRKEFRRGFADRKDLTQWAHSCFAVLDERFLQDGTALLVSINEVREGDEMFQQALNHRCEASISLDLLMQYEANRLGIDSHDDKSDDWDQVLTEKKYMEMRGVRVADGEKLPWRR